MVRVTAAPGFSRRYVVPKLPSSFRARYFKVIVELLVSERTSTLVEEGIDLAIRNGALSDSSSVARKIGESVVVAVASAEYLERRGEPTRPSGDLDQHDGVIFVSQDGPRPWTFASRAEGDILSGGGSRFAAMMAKSNAPRSLPASVSPRRLTWLFAADIRAGTVRANSCAIVEPARIPISAVRPASRAVSPARSSRVC